MAATCPFSKEQFINRISDLIRKCGYATFLCGNIIKTDIVCTAPNYLHDRDRVIAEKYAKEAGFRYSYKRDHLGIREITFEL